MKKSSNSHPAIDSNEAAKQNGQVKIDPIMVSILNSLIKERDFHAQAAQQGQAKINGYLKQCAESKGLKPEEFEFNDEQLAFVPVKAK